MWIKNNITAKIIKLTLLTTICIVSLSFSSLANTNYYAGGEPGVQMGMQVEGQLAYSRGSRYYDEFKLSDNTLLKNQWLCSVSDTYFNDYDISWYYFDKNGRTLKRWQTINGKTYYLDDSIGQAEYGWFKYNEDWYYFEPNTGIMQTSGTYEKDGILYNIGSDGKAHFVSEYSAEGGWREENEKWVFYRDGGKVKNDWISDLGIWYYFDSDGYMVGDQICSIDGNLYSFAGNGHMETNIEKFYNGVNYYFGEDGIGVRKAHKYDNIYRHNEVVQWFNATYAILTKSNNGACTYLGGYAKNSSFDSYEGVLELLQRDWGITDRASGENAVANLLLSAQNADHSTKAWYYSRAMQLSAWFYLVDYCTEQESLDRQLEIAKMIQPEFSSWDDFNRSYMNGYQKWSNNEEKIENRQFIYNYLNKLDDGPFTIRWSVSLTKTW